ncbi:MAG: NifU family protein [Chlamydiota bacterium]|nr:NifU family protein [Chlamydiota bacterium]
MNYWKEYSQQAISRILSPRHVGCFPPERGEGQGVRSLMVREGKSMLSALVDEEDGRFIDVRFLMTGPSHLVAMLDLLCEEIVGKDILQVGRFTVHFLDQRLRDPGGGISLPQELSGDWNHILMLLDSLCEGCIGILPGEPMLHLPKEEKEGTPLSQWDGMDKSERMRHILDLLDREIAPYVALDGGGVRLIDLRGSEVDIAYEGACVSCPASLGSTLEAIQKLLRKKVEPNLVVVPHFLTDA